MIFIKPSVEVMTKLPKDLLKQIELRGRVCYKSEERITTNSSEKFVSTLIMNGHESVLEHFSITARFICDRGVSHEIVRHRIGSYSQESTRYCNYGKGEVAFIDAFPRAGSAVRQVFSDTLKFAEASYKELLRIGVAPQMARSVLPNALKTDIIVTYNLREWRHFLRLRASPKAHPQMQELAGALLFYLRKEQPILFGDVGKLNHMTHLADLITPDGKTFQWDPTKE